MPRPIRAARLLQTAPGPMAPPGRAPRSRRGAPWGESGGGESRAPLPDALPEPQVPGVHRPHQGMHCMCPSSVLRGALPTSRGAFPSPRRASPTPRGALIAPRGASSTSLHHPCPGAHCLLPGVHPPCPGFHHPPPCRAGGSRAPLPLLFPQLSQAPGLLPGSLLSSWSTLESKWSTRGFPLVLPRRARRSVRPCAPVSLGPCQPQQAQPPQRSHRGTSPPTAKRGGKAPKPALHPSAAP